MPSFTLACVINPFYFRFVLFRFVSGNTASPSKAILKARICNVFIGGSL